MKTAAIVLVAAAFGIEGPVHQYGRVVLEGSKGIPAVTFDHFRHRARFTCRLCHVDVGFAMKAGGTGVTDVTIRKGFHCGACHDGKTAFSACSTGAVKAACRRCHGGDDDAAAREHAALKLPRLSFGEVDWQKAEDEGKVHPVDALPGDTPRPPLKMDRDVSFESSSAWMNDVKFSHKKHAVWNGCEVCHPEIFPRTQAGSSRFTMFQIADGESCGVCHGKVAFALAYCDKCHVKPVRFP